MRARSSLLVATAGLLAGAMAVVACTPEPGEPPPMTKGFGDDFATTEHEDYFPIGPTAKHALSGTITCNACHDGFDSFQGFTCLGCHARNTSAEDALKDIHADYDAAFRLDDNYCYRCHPTGQRFASGGGDEGEGEGDAWNISPAEHGQYFPIDPATSDTHSGLRCGQCHADNGGDPTLTSCKNCHGSADHSDPGLVQIYDAHNTEAGCLECHAATPINPAIRPFSNHNAVSGPSGGFGTVHFNAITPATGCKHCHSTMQAEPKSWAIDFESHDCTTCHNHDPGCEPTSQDPC